MLGGPSSGLELCNNVLVHERPPHKSPRGPLAELSSTRREAFNGPRRMTTDHTNHSTPLTPEEWKLFREKQRAGKYTKQCEREAAKNGNGSPPPSDPWAEGIRASDIPLQPEPEPQDHIEDIPYNFLQKLRPGGPWVLTAAQPDRLGIETITARDADGVLRFVAKHDGKWGHYYSPNPTRTAMTKKAAKTDISAIEFVLGDLDPKGGETSEAAKSRYLTALKTFTPAPSAIVDSGNGIQVLWRLAD